MAKTRDEDQDPAARFIWQEGDIQIIAPGPRHPAIKVRLSGSNGNIFNLIGIVLRALRDAGVPQAEIDGFLAEVKAGDYDHALQVMMAWVDVT